MKIQKNGEIGTELVNELNKIFANKDDICDKKLQEQREDLDQKPPETSIELALDGDTSNREHAKKSQPVILEKKLDEKKLTGNSNLQGTIEKRLNVSSKDSYPHRNPEAYKRTGNKRPVNNLPEEMGKASDQKRLERYEAIESKQKKEERILDKDIGKQKTLDKKSFNLKKSRNLPLYMRYSSYIDYKSGNKDIWSQKTRKLNSIDKELDLIMSKNRILTKEEQEKVLMLKQEKSKVIGICKNSDNK